MNLPRWRLWFNTRDKADTLLLLAACVLVLAPHMLHLPLWTSLICLVALGWRAAITLSGKRLPPALLLVPVAVGSLGMAFLEFHTLLGRNAGVAMLVLLLAFKLLEMRARRDLYVVVFLSFFIVLTNFFYSQSPGTAAVMIAAVIVLLAAQLSFQYTGTVPSLARRLALAAKMVGLALPLTLILFVLFPRIQGPLWGLPNDTTSARTGLSDRMAPGTLANLARSDELAFRVKFSDKPPPNAELYWRAIVLSDFDGSVWTPRHRPAPPLPLNVQADGPVIRYQITQEATAQRWMFALEMPRALPQLDGNPVRVTQELELQAATPLSQRVRYELASHAAYRLQTQESVEQLQNNLQLPPGSNPRTLAYGQALRRGGQTDDAVVAAVLKLFHDEKFSYTLRPQLLGRDGVDEFLFDTRAGFCEHYAGAFTVLMRAAGIPARVVTGYQGGEINPVDGYMAVRQSDAHAWAEVWLSKRGWVRVDPTAAVSPARVEQNLAGAVPQPAFEGVLGPLAGIVQIEGGHWAWLNPVRFNLAAAGNAWNQWVLDYTPQRQRDLLRKIGLDSASSGGAIALMAGLGMLAMALGLLPQWLKRTRRDRLDALYFAFCQLMAQRGHPRARHEGPSDYRARLLAVPGDAPGTALKKDALGQFLTLYIVQKYGLPPAQSSPESTLKPHDTRGGSLALHQLKRLLTQCR